MREKVEALIKDAKQIADFLKSFSSDVRIISHYDSDGICSASIMSRALVREGKSFRLTFVKKLSDEKVKELGREDNRLTVFTDLGSGKLDAIQKDILGPRPEAVVVVSDHHSIRGEILPENKSRLMHLNPINYDITENVSGSGITYILARAMGVHNRDLSELAMVGAIGDSQMGSIGPDWGLFGLNKEILKDAQSEKKVRVERGLRLWGRYTRPVHKALQYSVDPYIPGISGSESASVQFLQEIGIALKENDRWRTIADLTEEEIQKLAAGIIKERIKDGRENPDWVFGDVYELLDKKDEFRDANEFATILNACGKLRKEYLGVALCLNNAGVHDEVRSALESYRRELGKAIGWLHKSRENEKIFVMKEFANYVLASDNIPEDFLSNAISTLNKSGTMPENKPVIAFADTEDNDVKVSARMNDEIENFSLNDVLLGAAEAAGGEAGGHKHAAGAVIPKGSEQTFINSVEEILKKNSGQTSVGDEKQEDIKSDGIKDSIEVKDGGKRGEREARSSGEAGEKTAAKAATAGRTAGGSQKMEGKGLVRYFGS